MKEDAIKNVLSAMSESIGKENVELYQKLIDGSGFKKAEGIEEFFYMFYSDYIVFTFV